jgi:Na+-transporting methylmalonyl-CoA/oxaloacetate decarboxylase gamma subunit
MSESLIAQAGNITIIGMLVVFVFLMILVVLMWLLGKTVQAMEKYFPQTVPSVQDNALIAVAIAAAKKFQGK